MAVQLTDYAVWAKGLAARLRVLQASFADDNPSTRQGYITDEIDRALKQVPSNKRRAWLDALSEEFPAWQSGVEPIAPAPLPNQSPTLSPDELVARLIQAAATLPESTRAEFAAKLAAAGLAPKASSPGAGLGAIELPPELHKALGLAPGETVSPERATRIFAALADVSLALDRWVWTLWKELAGQKSNIRRENDGTKLLGQYLKGDEEVSGQQVVQAFDRTKKLNAGLLYGIGRAGASFAAKHLDQFGPEIILDLAKIERGFKALEVRAWNKYVELANEYSTQPVIEKRIQEAIVRAAEELINRGRAGS